MAVSVEIGASHSCGSHVTEGSMPLVKCGGVSVRVGDVSEIVRHRAGDVSGFSDIE